MLLVDVGNSAVVVASWSRSAAGVSGVPATRDLAIEPLTSQPLPPDEDGRRRLADTIAAEQRQHGHARAAITSVVPDFSAHLCEALSGAWAVDHRAEMPFALNVSAPAAVGADRYCNMAAAAGRGWPEALVVDAGTATTFDVLTGGVFVGGLIAPGVQLAANALGEGAARLPHVVAEAAPARPVADTLGAMAAGAFLAGVHGIAGTIGALLAECGDRPVVLTGGLAPLLLAAHMDLAGRSSWHHDPLWTLKGLALLAALNVPATD